MNLNITKIGFGGGCHWSTEAVFQSLNGVEKVEQGYVASMGKNYSFSEAVIVYFKPEDITLHTLIEIHLHTHKSNSNHTMRDKYRSAIYTFSKVQKKESTAIVEELKSKFENKLITKILAFENFRPSREQITNYYYSNPEKPFCESFINPKLKLLLSKFSNQVDKEKLKHLKTTS